MRKINAIATALLLLASGCATSRTVQPVTTPPPGIHGSKIEYGHIGVTRAQYAPRIEVQAPPKGAKEGALLGAAEGAVGPIVGSLALTPVVCALSNYSPYCLLTPVVGVAMGAVFGVAGSVAGAVTADSAGTVSEQEAIIKEALARLDVQQRMSDQFMYQLAALDEYEFYPIDGAGPTEEGVRPDYSTFHADGSDIINEIEVKRLGFTGLSLFRIELEVENRIISTKDNISMHCKIFRCASEYYSLKQWVDDEHIKLLNEIDSCYLDIANWVVDDMYTDPPTVDIQKDSLLRKYVSTCL